MERQRISDIPGRVNTPESVLKKNIEHSIRLQLPQTQKYRETNKVIILACGGPSLKKELVKLRELYDSGINVVTVNNAHDYLNELHITPAMHVMLDARQDNVEFVRNPVKTCKYFIASQCHPDVFDALRDNEVYIWHSPTDTGITQKVLEDFYKGHYIYIDGGTTVTLRSLMLLRILGYSRFEIFGFDSCWMEDDHHSYNQTLNDKDNKSKVYCGDREFYCATWMVKQADDFLKMVKHKGKLFNINVHGDGLIAHMLKTGAELKQQEE